MSNYSVLKQDINNNIYENQTQQITGTVLNAILNEMTASLGAGYQFAGVATLGMNPGDPDQRVFYLAGEGVYTNFGGLQVPAGKLGVLKWDFRWTLQTIDGLGGGGANLTGYVSLASTDDLPEEGQPTLGYLCGTNLYLYVGTGGDTKEGKYQNCGSFRGPQGLQGDPGVGIASVTQTTTSTEDEGINVITVTKEDGTQSTFQVRNGSKGSQGIQGPQGVQGEPGRLQAQYKEVETLPTASADTVDYIYLVASQTPDVYDMYYTEENQGAYSWKSLGTTAVQLSDYATKAEVSQLQQEVDENHEEHEIDINNINAAVNGSSEIIMDYPEALQFIWLPLPTLQAGNTYTFGLSISAAISQDLQGNIYKSDKSTVVRYFKISAGDTSNSTTITPDSDVVGGFMRVYSAAVVSNIKITLSCESLLTRVATLIGENATSKTIESKLSTIEKWLINADFSFTRVDRYYINGSGEIAYSSTFSYTQPMAVSEGDVIVMWRQGIGCAALCSCDSNGDNVKVIKMNAAGDTSDSTPVLYAYKVGIGVNYVMLSSKTDAFVNHPAFVMKESAFKSLDLGLETLHSLRTSGNNDKFNRLNLKGGCRYRFKVIDTGVVHLFSIYIKGDEQAQTNIWTNFNNYSYNTWYELIPSGDCEVYIWNQYWGNDINGNPVVDVPIEVEVIFHNYEGEQNELVAKDAIIKEDACANDSSVFSATHILGKLGNLPMYDASCAMANDNDTFIKVFHIDCGRKYFSPTNIKTMISACAENGVQFVQLHLSDNQGLRFVPNDSTFVFDGVEYDLADVAGDGLSIGASVPDGSDKWLDETDMDGILEYAKQEGVGIIPSIDMPAHMGTILLLLYPESSAVTTLDIRTNGNTDFALKVAEKYVTYFANKGCKYYNFGCDEAKVNGLPFPRETYTNFINTLAHLVVSYDMIPVCYCDAICNKDEKFPYINKGIDVIYWNETLANVAQPQTLKEFGYKMIRSGGNKILYYILGKYTPEEEADFLASLRTRTISESLYRGVMFALWCDNGAADGADDGDAVTAKMVFFIEAFGEVTPV